MAQARDRMSTSSRSTAHKIRSIVMLANCPGLDEHSTANAQRGKGTTRARSDVSAYISGARRIHAGAPAERTVGPRYQSGQARFRICPSAGKALLSSQHSVFGNRLAVPRHSKRSRKVVFPVICEAAPSAAGRCSGSRSSSSEVRERRVDVRGPQRKYGNC
jgi:hypothetical protein